MKVAYIAGPYRAKTINGIAVNIHFAEEVAKKYWEKGYAVICPHKNTAFFDGFLDNEVWLDGDLEILRRCDVIVAMKGWDKSWGASKEIELAMKLKKEIIYD